MVFTEREAYHEAGHAVVGYLLGMTPVIIRTLPSWMPDSATTRCIYYRPLSREDRVLHDLAGYAAQVLSGTFSEDDKVTLLTPEVRIGDMDDLFQAGVRAGDELKALFSKCSDMLTSHWPMVERLATALVGHRQIGGEQLKTLLQDGLMEVGYGQR